MFKTAEQIIIAILIVLALLFAVSQAAKLAGSGSVLIQKVSARNG